MYLDKNYLTGKLIAYIIDRLINQTYYYLLSFFSYALKNYIFI